MSSFTLQNVRKNDSIKYMVDEVRKHDVTDERVCRPRDEMKFLAETYLCYLKSTRQYRHLHSEYHSKDKSPEEAAKLVGLELPKNRTM